MADDLAGKSIGQRIQAIRERRGKTRAVVAGLVGRSESWLKAVERGRLHCPKLPVLVRLAEVLEVEDLSELTGQQTIPLSAFQRVPHEAVPDIREAVHTRQLVWDRDRDVDVAALRGRVIAGWRLWHTTGDHRAQVGRILPSLITDARAAVRASEGRQCRDASAVLADVYHLAQHAVVWAAETELLWLIADRGMAAAEEADQPLALAGAAWNLGNLRRSTGDIEGALELANDAVAMLEPYLDAGEVEVCGMWGALRLHAAVTAARDGREGDTWWYWDQADRMAERLGGYHHYWSQFGRSNVAVHAVSIGVALYKSKEARRRAQSIDPYTVPSVERRGRLLAEIARSHYLDKDYAGALHWLRRAYDTSSDAVLYSPSERALAGELPQIGGPLIEREAREFAEKVAAQS